MHSDMVAYSYLPVTIKEVICYSTSIIRMMPCHQLAGVRCIIMVINVIIILIRPHLLRGNLTFTLLKYVR